MKDTILIIDDLENNRLILREILQNDYIITDASSGQEALDLLFQGHIAPQAILLDIIMPGMDGFEVLTRIKCNWKTRSIPVLIITADNSEGNESVGLKMGATDYISRPFNPEVVKARVDNCIQLQHYRLHLESLVEQKTREVAETHERILEVMATIIEYRSYESSAHIRRTGVLCALLIEYLLQTPKYRDQLENCDYPSMIKAMSLHDIGKVAIPDHILLKPGKLTPEEFEVVKQHTVIGDRIIDSICESLSDITPYLRHCKDICRSHHERWDGAGYPDGLAGEEIPLSARILSIVDVFDALASSRCYKPPFPYDYCFQLIVEGRGTQFDPDLVDAVISVQNEFKNIHAEIVDPVVESVPAPF